MESIKELNHRGRQECLVEWLRVDCDLSSFTLTAMQGDASFRRYFRVMSADKTYVVMDAPPPQENCRPFVAIANALRHIGLQTPSIIQADLKRGFLLLSDFGDHTYLSQLTSINADQLYEQALTALAQLQSCRCVHELEIPLFSADFMQNEWSLHKEWFLQKLLNINYSPEENALDICYHDIVASAVKQPQVFMHRDYHAGNLMVLANHQVGILDFQDAFIGPVTYDLVSLLRDCYIDWPNENVTRWVLSYWQKLQSFHLTNMADQATFLRWFDWMGVQRHLKALLTFARKHVRDQQSHYLTFVPRTLNYLQAVSGHYDELSSLHHFISKKVKPAFENKIKTITLQNSK